MKKLKLDLSNLTSKEILSKVQLKKIMGGYEIVSNCGLEVGEGTFYSDGDGCGKDVVSFIMPNGDCAVNYYDPVTPPPCGWA